MIDPDALAGLLCDYCLEVAPGQQVAMATTTLAQELALAFQAAVLQREAWPLLWLDPPGLRANFFRHARGRQLDAVAPVEQRQVEGIDAIVRVEAPANPRALSAVDPELQQRVARGHRPLREAILGRRWALSLWPTPGLAQEARMDEVAYAEFVERALLLDHGDPVARWRELSRRQAVLVDRLQDVSEVRIVGERSDLRLSVAGRTWINSDGRRNMPSGEVFTGPIEDSAEGTIHFDIPSAHGGRDVAGVTLEFRGGEVVRAEADRGGEYLHEVLRTDSGARWLGELGIGTNPGIDRATGSTLLDEKIAGTVHLALGRSYPETGGRNESAVHWDLICDLRTAGRVEIDGEVLIRDGAFE